MAEAAIQPIPAEPPDRKARRAALRQINLQAWSQDGLGDSNKPLDASLKRNTAFIKRLRTALHAADSPGVFLKEIAALSLDKYVSELVSATAEGLAKCKTATEVWAAVEVISALHQRFPRPFTVPLIAQLTSALRPSSKATTSTAPEQREKDERERISRQRGLLRIYGELEAVAVVKGEDGKGRAHGESLYALFKELLTADKSAISLNVPLATAFCKHLGVLYLPTSAATATEPTPAESQNGIDKEHEQKDKFRVLLVAYFEALGRRAIKDRLNLLETDRRNHEAYIRSGEIFEDRAQAYEKLVKTWDKEWAGLQSLSELLGDAVTLPELPTLPSQTVVGAGVSLHTTEEYSTAGSKWLDDEERRFYEDLLDLKGEVPFNLLGGTATTARDNAAKLEEAAAALEALKIEDPEAPIAQEPVDDAMLEEEEPPLELNEEPEAPEDALPAAPSAQLTALFARLPDKVSIDAIDRAAVEFAFLNSKGARKRLIKHLAAAPKSRQDLLPYYSRFIATLNRYMPDVAQGVLASLEDEFKYLQKRKRLEMRDMRPRNIRYLSELTKFGVTPAHTILHMYKVCLDDLSGYNVDNLCLLLENCGRYLLRTETTHEKMTMMLEVMKRKRAVQNLDARQVAMLDNAYYQCNPPDRPAIPPKEYTPMELFIRHVVYDVLNRNTLEKAHKLLRKLHWDDPLVHRKLYNAFTKVWKIKYSHIQLLALLLYDLNKYHADFCCLVIDANLEMIRVGLESNSFKQNQQRVAAVKYLGELYNYKMVDSKVIFDTLWSFCTFGHAEGRPWPDMPSPIDAPDDFFRVRLVCTLLDTCYSHLDRGANKAKVGNFLTFFQLYIHSKTKLPMDVGFMVSDLFEAVRPKAVRYDTFDEVLVAVDEMLAAHAHESRNAAPSAQEDEDSDRELPDDAEAEPFDGDDTAEASTADLQPEEIEVEVRREISTEERDAFERELALMMSETSGDRARVSGKAAKFDVGLPISKQARQEETSATLEPDGSSKMVFTMLTKKGSKAHTRSVEVPAEAAIAVHSRTKQLEGKAEQEQLKRLVLDYEARSEEERRQALRTNAARSGIKLTFKPAPD